MEAFDKEYELGGCLNGMGNKLVIQELKLA